MTARTRQSLKNIFENGDETSTANFSDLIDSFLSFSDTSAQTVLSPVTLSALKFTTASGTTLETRTITTSGLRVTGTMSADTALVAMGDVSASSMNITASVSASSLDFNSVFVAGSQLPKQNYGGMTLVSPISASIVAATLQFYPGTYTAYGTQVNWSALSTGGLKYLGEEGKNHYFVATNTQQWVQSPDKILASSELCIKTAASASAHRMDPGFGINGRVEYDELYGTGNIDPGTFSLPLNGIVSAVTSVTYGIGHNPYGTGLSAVLYLTANTLVMVEI